MDALSERGVEYLSVEKAILKNWQLVFDIMEPEIEGMGYADIIPIDGEVVEGAVFLLKDRKSLKALDRYEGVPEFYLREEVIVELENNIPISCFTYVANPFNTSSNLKPTKAYLQEILAGKPFFSDAYFKKIREIKTLD